MGTRDRIIGLHKQRLTNAEIARAVGVTRQRVWAVLNPKRTETTYDISALLAASKEARIAPMPISSVATLLGVNANTIRRWSDKGIIQCFRLGTRNDRRFELQHVIAMLRERIK